MEHLLEKNMENEMETGSVWRLIAPRFGSFPELVVFQKWGFPIETSKYYSLHHKAPPSKFKKLSLMLGTLP